MNSKQTKPISNMKNNPRAMVARTGLKPLVIAMFAVLMMVTLAACDLTSLTGLPAESVAPTPAPAAPGAQEVAPQATGTPARAAPRSGTTSAATINAIKAGIEEANREEVQAFASNDPSVMADTATTEYYQQMAQSYNDMASSNITAIQLDNLVWGTVTLQGTNKANANTTETWTTTYSDGGTTQQTDPNVY